MNSNPANALDIVTIGESMIVLVTASGNPLETASTLSMHCAGAESNVAHYLAQLGHRVGWASRLGDDPFGRRLLTEFESAGIDTSHVAVTPDAPTGIYFKDSNSSPSVFYYRSSSAASAMNVDELMPALEVSKRLHVTGITAALNAHSSAVLRKIMMAARARSLPVSFDINYRPALWPVEQAAPELASLTELADIVFVGRDEAETLWNTPSADDVRDALPHVPALVVKDGAIGATEYAAERKVFVPAPTVELVEPVGAGDAFAAGYLSAIMDERDGRAALRLGHLFAAHAIRTRADYAQLPERDELDRLTSMSDDDWANLSFTGESEH